MNRETFRQMPYYRYNYGYNYPINSRGPFRQGAVAPLPSVPHLDPSGHVLTTPLATGPIDFKYQMLKRRGFTGDPIIPELPTAADGGVGRYRIYRNGGGEWIIVWHPETGAHEIHGAIYEKWKNTIGDNFGFPITDELTTPDGIGRFNHFRGVHEPGKPEGSTPNGCTHGIWSNTG